MIARTEIISSTVMTMTVAALCHRRSGIIIVLGVTTHSPNAKLRFPNLSAGR
jgi:hypothetical protein